MGRGVAEGQLTVGGGIAAGAWGGGDGEGHRERPRAGQQAQGGVAMQMRADDVGKTTTGLRDAPATMVVPWTVAMAG